VHDAGRIFRRLLAALAQPGRPANLLDAFAGLEDAPSGAARPLAAALLALADFETPVWLDHDAEGLVRSLVNFHCGAPLVDDPRRARFAVVTEPDRMPPLAAFDWGSAEYPDACDALDQRRQPGRRRSGDAHRAGHRHCHTFAPQGLPDHFWSQRTMMQKTPLRRRLLSVRRPPRGRSAADHASPGGRVDDVAVKGGEAAILASLEQVDAARRGDRALAAISVAQIREQMRLAVAG